MGVFSGTPAVFGVDYAWGRPGASALKRAGAKFACRYLSHDTTGKNLTRAEAGELSAAGLWLVVVWETTANRALDGKAAGRADAQAAAAQAKACGMPDDRPVYFAVDWDASSSQQGAINAYLDGAASVLGRGRVGLYGGYGPVNRAFDAGKIAFGWQTYAWSGGRWDKRAQLQQYSNDHTINGVGLDYDRAVKSDYGQWRVGVSPTEEDQDPMPEYVSVGVTKTQKLAPGKWTNVSWQHDYADTKHQHADSGGPSILWGSARYALTAAVTVTGVPAGTLIQARVVEIDAKDDSRFEAGPLQDYVSTGNETNIVYSLGADTVRADHRVRLQVIQHGTAAATVASGSAKVFFWR
ncbi:glycoside hydrolase domain-containing protein [Actinomadura nitritigenes]|uniref:glycoside hydrolase domain-containing protein n=1 Tax=Actinomadura nitritigenes TaxID=134602 RepID=UPI003D8C94B8